MQCFHTKSRTHHQRYTLVAAQAARASIRYAHITHIQSTLLLMLLSRAAAQATSATSGVSAKKKSATKLDAVFAGDILLKFKHSPKVAESGK